MMFAMVPTGTAINGGRGGVLCPSRLAKKWPNDSPDWRAELKRELSPNERVLVIANRKGHQGGVKVFHGYAYEL